MTRAMGPHALVTAAKIARQFYIDGMTKQRIANLLFTLHNGHLNSLRENQQRPNEQVLTPIPGGHDTPSALSSPDHRQGHDLSIGLDVPVQ